MQFTSAYQGLLDRIKVNSGTGTASASSGGARKANTAPVSARDSAIQICAAYLPVSTDFQVGKTRMFLRPAAYSVLQTEVKGLVVHKISVFQALVRKHLARKKYQKTMRAVVAMQSRLRMFVKQKIYKKEMADVVRAKVQSKKAIQQRNQVCKYVINHCVTSACCVYMLSR